MDGAAQAGLRDRHRLRPALAALVPSAGAGQFRPAGENLRRAGGGVRARLARIASVLQIEALLPQTVKSLSLGQRMRCEIAASLLHRPKILLLDEPTIGLDVTAKALLREHLKHLAETEETTIMLTSHDTGDIEEICDRVILINHGRILLDKPLAALRAEFLAKKRVTLITDDEAPAPDIAGAAVIARAPHSVTLEIDPAVSPLDKVVAEALRTLSVRDLTIENAPLEEIIRTLYGEKRAVVQECNMSALLHCFRLGWRAGLWAQKAGLLSVFGFYAVLIGLWASLWHMAAPAMLARAGLTYAQAVWYGAAGELVVFAVSQLYREVEDDVQGGEVTAFLLRPIGYVPLKIAEALGTGIVQRCWPSARRWPGSCLLPDRRLSVRYQPGGLCSCWR